MVAGPLVYLYLLPHLYPQISSLYLYLVLNIYRIKQAKALEGMKIQKLKSPKIQNMLQSNRAASDGAKGHRIGNRLGKFSPNAVEGLYMYPVCGEKGVHCVFIPSTGRILQVKSFRLAVDHGLGQLLVQYADKSSPQSIDPIFRPYADPSVDPESLEIDRDQAQSPQDQGVTVDQAAVDEAAVDDGTEPTSVNEPPLAIDDGEKPVATNARRVRFDMSEPPATRSATKSGMSSAKVPQFMVDDPSSNVFEKA